MLTETQISDAVKDVLPNVLAGLKKQIAEQALYSAQQAMTAEINKAVTAWIVENLIPEIHAALTSSKEGIISAAPRIADGIVVAMSDSLVESVKKKLESSWERKKIFEALIG